MPYNFECSRKRLLTFEVAVQGNVDNRASVCAEAVCITESSFSKVIRDVHTDLLPKQAVEVIWRKPAWRNLREGQRSSRSLHVCYAILDDSLGTQGQALLCY